MAAALLAVLATAGCGIADAVDPSGGDRNIPLTTADVVGTWRNAQFGGTLSFAADGTFSATEVPYEVYLAGHATPAGFDPAHDRLDDRGTWRLVGAYPGDQSSRMVTVTLVSRGNATFPRGFSSNLDSWRQSDGSGSLVMEVPNAPRFHDQYSYAKG